MITRHCKILRMAERVDLSKKIVDKVSRLHFTAQC
jgi:hypothetical protein